VLFAGAPANAVAGGSSGALIVGFTTSLSHDGRENAVRNAGGTVDRDLRAIRALSVRPRRGVALAALRRALERASGVRYVEPDFELVASAEPDDPLYAAQYAFSQPSDHDIDAPEGWDVTRSCSKVAVIDSGTDVDHPDLAANLWKNTEEKKNNGKDDDKNGYVDDYYGVDLDDGRGSGVDENGHGTHVAGIIGAVGDNGFGVAGICWKASVMSVRFMDARGRGSTSAAVEGIEYAIREGARILNCSFGSSSKSEALQDAVQYAKSKGALLVVAAGNDGEDIDREPTYPASFGDGNIVSVAASTADDGLATFSNFGDDDVDLAAPGEGILSTYPNDSYRSLDGTSMAAPYVAGAAGLLKKRNPDATYEEIRAALRKKVDKPPALNGKVVYDGRLNVTRALAAIEP
jgi:subtilisin family serine protease